MNQFRKPIRKYGLLGSLSKGLSNPVRTYRHLFQQDQGEVLPEREFERPPTPTELVRFITDLGLEESREVIVGNWLELCDDEQFRSEVRSTFESSTAAPGKFYHNWRDVLYVLLRVLRPSKVVETGVRGGLSSAYMLNGLERNGSGRLVSVDVGDVGLLPPDIEEPKPGWIVSQRLHTRWDLRIGDSRTELPAVLDRTTDMFFSDVPNDLLRDELSIAAEEMPPGSLIVTCTPRGSQAEDLWREFAQAALSATASATRWESGDDRSDLHAGILGEDAGFGQ